MLRPPIILGRRIGKRRGAGTVGERAPGAPAPRSPSRRKHPVSEQRQVGQADGEQRRLSRAEQPAVAAPRVAQLVLFAVPAPAGSLAQAETGGAAKEKKRRASRRGLGCEGGVRSAVGRFRSLPESGQRSALQRDRVLYSGLSDRVSLFPS
jgi:hypothetical protein